MAYQSGADRMKERNITHRGHAQNPASVQQGDNDEVSGHDRTEGLNQREDPAPRQTRRQPVAQQQGALQLHEARDLSLLSQD